MRKKLTERRVGFSITLSPSVMTWVETLADEWELDRSNTIEFLLKQSDHYRDEFGDEENE